MAVAIWGRKVMTVAARPIDWEAWSQSRFLAWAETQPEGCRYEFDGSGQSRWPQPPLATTGSVATSGRLSAPGCRQGRHATPMDRRMRSKQSAAPCESRTRSSRVPGRTGTRSPCRRRSLYLKSFRPGGVIGDGTRRRSTSTDRCPRYSAMLWLNTKVDHSVRSAIQPALHRTRRRGRRSVPPGSTRSAGHPRLRCSAGVNELERLCRQ